MNKQKTRSIVGLPINDDSFQRLQERLQSGFPLRGKVTVNQILMIHDLTLEDGVHTPQSLAQRAGCSVKKVRISISYLLRFNLVSGVDLNG